VNFLVAVKKIEGSLLKAFSFILPPPEKCQLHTISKQWKLETFQKPPPKAKERSEAKNLEAKQRRLSRL